MSMRFGRGLLAATALSFLAVGGLHATAAMAAVPEGLDGSTSSVVADAGSASAMFGALSRVTDRVPPGYDCTDTETGLPCTFLAPAAMAAAPAAFDERADLVGTLPMPTDSGEPTGFQAGLGEIIWCSDPSGF